jgi:PAS domain S-box-containing protein
MRSNLFDSSILATAQQAVEFVSNILESSTEYSLIGKDMEGKILLWNEGARRMHGYSAEEVVGKLNSEVYTLRKTSPPESRAKSWRLQVATSERF